MKNALVQRLSEPSTYAGLAGLALAVGISAEEWEVYAQGLAGLFAIVAMLLGEKPQPRA